MTQSGLTWARLPRDVMFAADEALERFEAAWAAGGDAPRIEDFIAGLPTRDYPELVVEFIRLDADFRRRAGETPVESDYADRFPAARGLTMTTGPAADAATGLGEVRSLQGGRYECLRLLGEGGMGEVWRARDTLFRRELAVKVMRHRPGESPQLARRFLEEARISARLQHPGVVPVYDLGEFGDGQHFFTMKLVEGQTLAELLSDRPNPADGLANSVKVFEQVAQAVAYAHSQGVIHRDLKPANVMVGAFGEVQVMDWGLAKALGEADDEAGVAADPRGHADTEAGTVLGTCAYMAPEQARGLIDDVDRRSDVFGLGAILCEILTGKPAYVGRGAKTYALAEKADLADALDRLARCGADPELTDLAKDCLAPEQDARPADAAAVAARVNRHLAAAQGRLQAERVERERRAVRAAERRSRRRWQAGVAASLALLSLLGAAALFVFLQERDLRRREAAAALGRAESSLRGGDLAGADAALGEAERRLGGGGRAGRAESLRSAHRLAARLEQIRLDAATWSGAGFVNADTLRNYRRAFAEAGIGVIGGPAERAAGVIRRSAARDYLLHALDHWAYLVDRRATPGSRQERDRLLTAARLAGPDGPLRATVYDPAMWDGPRRKWAEVAGRLRPEATSPQLLRAVAWRLPERPAIRFLEAGVAAHPTDFWLHYILGTRLKGAERYAEACGAFRAALAIRPDVPAVLNDLGVAQERGGDPDAAIRTYRRALKIDPGLVPAKHNLGTIFHRRGEYGAAAREFRAALLALPDSPKILYGYGMTLMSLGDAPGAARQWRRALQSNPKHAKSRQALALHLGRTGDRAGAVREMRRAAKDAPESAEIQNNLGMVLLLYRRDAKGAEAAFRKATRLDPRNATAQYNLGKVLRSRGDLDGSIKHYGLALKADPQYASAHIGLGLCLMSRKDYAGAVRHFRRASALNPKGINARINLALALYRTGDFTGAVEECRKALAADPDNDKALTNLGLAEEKLGRAADAERHYRAALKANPHNRAARSNLGRLLKKR